MKIVSKICYFILKLLPQNEIEDYAYEVLTLMDRDTWQDIAAEESFFRHKFQD